ncbi:phosphoadenosine phosphosulfate reductase family protein [uncultured Croceitalea sp.]|uniref:phosphoadenosine phosphosulfate reductase domain-containing protein n=1 Tax=uncultured Croceitalea sp. TaxID=1798908 RepID=UPI00330680A6
MRLSKDQVQSFNKQFKGIPPEEIIQWAINFANRPVLTSNFKPYSVVLLHAVTMIKRNIPTIWCDTGYNTPETYRYANKLSDVLNLNLKVYRPRQTSAYIEAIMGGVPDLDSPMHTEFTELVKLEPFKRAMEEHQPDVWFTNIRKGQTEYRDTLDILSLSADGVLKVSPFYHWSETELESYLYEWNLSNEHNYFDPTKVLEHRECGIHFS